MLIGPKSIAKRIHDDVTLGEYMLEENGLGRSKAYLGFRRKTASGISQNGALLGE